MKTSQFFSMIFVGFGLISCGSSDDESSESTSTRTTTGTVEATDVSQLGLTGALQMDLPDALSDSDSSSLNLVGEKSIEACLMRESASQLLQQITAASSVVCHVEAEGTNIPWNTPIILDFSGMEEAAALRKLALQAPGDIPDGPEGDFPEEGDDSEFPGGDETSGDDFSMNMLGIYADDSDGDNIAVYICEGEDEDSMELVQSFVITGSKTITVDGESVQASKGVINIAQGDEQMGEFKGAISFDSKYSEESTTTMKMEVKFSFTGFAFAQRFGFEDNGTVTEVSISETGTMSFGSGDAFSFKNAGIGLFDADYGNVFYSYESDQDTFATQACVDSDSLLIGCDDDVFASGGDLYLEASDVPAVLTADFSPAAPSGFDCSTATWTTYSPSTDEATMEKHEACDASMMESDGGGMSSCFDDQDYAQSDASVEIEFSEEEGGDDFLDIEPGEDEEVVE